MPFIRGARFHPVRTEESGAEESTPGALEQELGPRHRAGCKNHFFFHFPGRNCVFFFVCFVPFGSLGAIWFWLSEARAGLVEVLLNMASFTVNIQLKISLCVVLMPLILECDDVIFMRLV